MRAAAAAAAAVLDVVVLAAAAAVVLDIVVLVARVVILGVAPRLVTCSGCLAPGPSVLRPGLFYSSLGVAFQGGRRGSQDILKVSKWLKHERSRPALLLTCILGDIMP